MHQALSNRRVERLFDKYVSPTKVNCYQESRYYFAWIEVTNRCPGSCTYCYVTTIDKSEEISIPEEKLKELIDDIKELRIHHRYWGGGDPLLYPRLFPMLEYAHAQGMSNGIFTSGLLLNQEMCKKLVSAYHNRLVNVLGIHIDTLDQGIARQIFIHPKELNQRIAGYKRLLETGFPPERVFNCLTLTRPSGEAFEQTFDWCIDDMGSHMSAGNIYEKSFIDIHEPNKEMLHFKTIKIKGKGAACEHNDVCFGCRGAAWCYLGDIEASDPKCWRNPEAPQYVWQTGSSDITR